MSRMASAVKGYAAAAKPSVEERNQMIVEHLPLVKYIAARIAGRLPSHVEVDDLVNAGILGLIDAIDKYDPTRKIKFKTYAEFRIRGAIIDELRALDWVPRSTRQKASRLERAYAEVEQRLGRAASDVEVAEHLGIPVEDLTQMLCEARGVAIISVDELRGEGDESFERNLLEYLADPETVQPDVRLNLDQVYQIVADAIEVLPEKERLVISLYYYDELTMKEIGEIMDITESRVSQIHTKAVIRLRSKLLHVLQLL
ncbi:MAG: FliA/WhiG family RNA polymerase sigma factor [Candidatus Sumerlaeia bacterium]|nr:FliA/WhiG family RNA polymerase sigma factor [Candidatus Sumerlaeia bacterium]